MGQDFPGFYSPRATVVDSIAKPIGNGDLMPGLQIPGIPAHNSMGQEVPGGSLHQLGAARTRR
jgi:hypothetical protein